jgi:hypothetical protein
VPGGILLDNPEALLAEGKRKLKEAADSGREVNLGRIK